MSSLSTSLYGSTTNKGVGGLMSGLDTDELVKQMTAATRNKINRQYQSKQKLSYRQEAYREISTKLLAFSDKYFSYASGSKTNILSPRFFEANTFKSSSNYVNVTGDAAAISNFKINSITQVATSAAYTTAKAASSSQSFSSDEILTHIANLAGDTMTIEHGGKNYDLKISKEYAGQGLDNYLNEIVAELNTQLDNIEDENGKKLSETIKYEAFNGEIKASGAPKLVAASNDILKAFNIEKIEANTLASSNGKVTFIEAENVILNGNITFDLNGVKKSINFSEMTKEPSKYTFDATGLNNYLNDQLSKAYGNGKVVVETDGKNITFSTGSEENNNVLTISGISSDLSTLTGIKSGDINRLNMSAPIGDISKDISTDISINGKKIEGINKDMSISDVLKKINNESDINVTYSSTTDRFVINSKETGSHATIKIEGQLAKDLFKDEIGVDDSITGNDTVMSYTSNGSDELITITRSTANFSLDGINIELSKGSKGLSDVTFDVTNNSDEVVERVKKFIDDYNEIINLIGTQTKEKPRRSYAPLTPEQQDEMEEKEIENWNKEAKKGVLFGDSKMNSLLSDLKTSLTGKTDVSDLILANIGIAAASMDTSGKLVLDEEKFKQKLLENPDEIASLFTDIASAENAKSGLAVQIRDVIRKNIGAYGTSGILIDEAGLDSGRTSDQNNISLKMKDYDDKMAELKKKLEVERKRYWDQFSALENSLNKLNAQSSWLTDMMG